MNKPKLTSPYLLDLSDKGHLCLLQVKPRYFARCLMEWAEKGFPELDDVCGNGLCPQIKAVISHPQFSEEPQKVKLLVFSLCQI